MASFKPSDVNLLGSFPPLIDTFGESGLECAAAMIVRALAVRSDTWRPLKLSELTEVSEEDKRQRTEPITAMSTNPFIAPDFAGLEGGGFGSFVRGSEGDEFFFTYKGLEALRKWVTST